METTEKREQKPLLRDGLIKGKWQLKYKLVNDLGMEGFGGRSIGPYEDPTTGKTRHLQTPSGAIKAGFWVDKQVMLLDSDDPKQRLEIDWLVGHPYVGIQNEQTKLDKSLRSKKESNPRFTLVNLDHQDVTDLVQEDYIDKLVGLISQDGGTKALSIEKLRYVLSHLDLEYREERLINNPAVEKTKLRSRLKGFVRSSYDNAKKVNDVLDKLEGAKYIYEIKEMVRTSVLTVNNGMYMYQGNPLGISYESLIKYFGNDPEFYVKLTEVLYETLKQEH